MTPLGSRELCSNGHLRILPAANPSAVYLSLINRALCHEDVEEHHTYSGVGVSAGQTLWAQAREEQVEKLASPGNSSRASNKNQKLLSQPEVQIESAISLIGKASSAICTNHNQSSWKETLERLDQPGIEVDISTIASLLRWCGASKNLSDGKRVHQHIIKHRLEKNAFLGNLLINMYGNSGALDIACDLFGQMHWRDNFCWNFMISSYTRHGFGKDALQLFDQMQQEGTMPDNFVFTSIVAATACNGSLDGGKQIHARTAGCILESDVALGTSLVNMYAKCGSLHDVMVMFSEMPERNTFSWTAVIAGYAQQDQSKDALQLFYQMLQEGVLPNMVTFISVLSACGSQETVGKCRWIHGCILKSGFQLDAAIMNAILNMYSKCGSMKDALKLFSNLPEHDVVSWNAMITAYVHHGQGEDALQCFGEMQKQGIQPNNVTFISIFSAFVSEADIVQGEQVHSALVHYGFEIDVNVGNALVNMYSRCGSLEYAQRMFDRISIRDVVSWNGLIAACVQHGHSTRALHLFNQMEREGMFPNKVTFISVLSACADKAALAEGEGLHMEIVKHGFESDFVVMNALVNMYGKCGSLDTAHEVFDKVPKKDTVVWTALMTAYAEHGHSEEVFKLFNQMHQDGVLPNKVTFVSLLPAFGNPAGLADGKLLHAFIADVGFEADVAVGTALVSMYGKCGSLEEARCVFHKIEDQNTPSWNSLIAAYVQHDESEDALQVFHQMQQEGVIPDKLTLISILSACVNQAAIAEGKQTHVVILESKFRLDFLLENALLHMYGKCGNLEDARRMFDEMSQRDAISWTSMIAAYAQHGQGKVALQFFKQMNEEEIKPDDITFTSILSACSHAGLVDEGRYFFDSMRQNHGINPSADHYNCMLDLLGRSRLLDEAETLIRSMPFQPSVVSWMTLLAACRAHVDVGRGERFADYLLELNPYDPSPYLVLSNIYTEVGKHSKEQRLLV